jgi:hypothetical protein
MDVASASAEFARPKRRWLRLPERLPDLKGKWLTLYSIVWAIMLPLAIVGPVRSAYVLSGWMAKPAWLPYGIGINTLPDRVQIGAVSSDEARRAGVRPGDRIIAIDGWTMPTSSSAHSLARAHAVKAQGASTVFALATPGEAPRDVRLTFTQRHFEEFFTQAGLTFTADDLLIVGSNLLTCFALVAAALLLFVRQRRKAVPAFLSLGFLMTAATDWGTNWTDLGISDFVSSQVDVAAWVLIFAALFGFPSGQLSPRWTRVALLLLPLLLFVRAISYSDNLVLPSFVVFLVAAVVALVGRYRDLPPGIERQQLRWVFFGFVAGSAMLVLEIAWTLLADELQSTDSRWWVWSVFSGLLGALGVVLITLGLIVSVLRYRLYDADTVIGRSAAYGILTLGFVGLFAGSEKLAELIGERYFEHSIGIAAGAIGAAVAAAVVVPLHNRVHHWAERRFQKALIRLRYGLPECVADLRESASVKQLAGGVMTRVAAGVHSTREAVLLCENGKWALAGSRGVSAKGVRDWQRGWTAPGGEPALDCDRSDALFPLRVRLCIDSGDEPETIGWLLLGPRPDGSMFGKDEREALAHVAGPVARAIHIAQLREQRSAEAEKRLSALEALIEKVASAIGGGRTAAPA